MFCCSVQSEELGDTNNGRSICTAERQGGTSNKCVSCHLLKAPQKIPTFTPFLAVRKGCPAAHEDKPDDSPEGDYRTAALPSGTHHLPLQPGKVTRSSKTRQRGKQIYFLKTKQKTNSSQKGTIKFHVVFSTSCLVNTSVLRIRDCEVLG